jgi:hypothetical protein
MSLASQVTLALQQVAAKMRLTSSSGVAPTNPYPGQLWYDTSVAAPMSPANKVGDGVMLAPTGTVPGIFRQTLPRWLAYNSTLVSTTSGRMTLVAIYLEAGEVVTNITFRAGGAVTTPTNQWFALYDSAGNLLRQTVNGTTGAWAVGAYKTLALTTPYTIQTSGFYYLAIMVAATGQPSLYGFAGELTMIQSLPVLTGVGAAGLGLTTTAPATTTIAGAVQIPWAAVS